MTRALVVGAGGMLGRDLLEALDPGLGATAPDPGLEVTALDRAGLDVTDPDAVQAAVVRARPDVVVNCAAWTAVDDAESHEGPAFAVNAVGPANLARACAASGARLVHISTDYVFAGDATVPYPEDAPIAPRSAYGRTKAAGEWAVRAYLPDRHTILRTAWLYGAHGPNFVATMARLEATRDTVDVVDDQTGQPTWTLDLAAQIATLIHTGGMPVGTLHATSSGSTTWYHLARAVFELLGADPDRVRPTTSAAFVRPAPRPAWSVLGHRGWAGTGIAPIRDWHQALTEAVPAMRSTADLA